MNRWPALIKSLKFKNSGQINLNVDKSSKIAFLEISHPSRNIMTSSMQLELRNKLELLHKESKNLHGVVLCGDPQNKAFCAGADLNEVKALAEYFKESEEKHLPMFEFMQETCDVFRRLLEKVKNLEFLKNDSIHRCDMFMPFENSNNYALALCQSFICLKIMPGIIQKSSKNYAIFGDFLCFLG